MFLVFVYCDVYHGTVLIIFTTVLIRCVNDTETSLLTKRCRQLNADFLRGITWILYCLIICE